MPRVKRGSKNRSRRKKILAHTKGSFQTKSKLYKIARESMERALSFAYAHRRRKKRDFRALWILRINAASRLHGLSYSRFMNGLHKANVSLDRKVLAQMAVSDPDAFGEIAKVAQTALAA